MKIFSLRYLRLPAEKHYLKFHIKSLAYYRHHDSALAGFDVTFQVKDLLPGSQDQTAFLDGNGQGRAEHGCLQMRMAVAVMPGLFMAVAAAGGHELVQKVRQVLPESRFVFNGAHGGRTADIENMSSSRFNAGLFYNLANVTGQVMQVVVPVGFEGEYLLVNHGDHPRVYDDDSCSNAVSQRFDDFSIFIDFGIRQPVFLAISGNFWVQPFK
jgi:hypothetical protein